MFARVLSFLSCLPGEKEEEEEISNPTLELEEKENHRLVAQRRRKFQASLSAFELARRKRALERYMRNQEVMPFLEANKWEGVKVGFPIFAHHLAFPDVGELACAQLMTEEVLMAGIDANAYQIVDFKWRDKHNVITVIQPRKIDPLPGCDIDVLEKGTYIAWCMSARPYAVEEWIRLLAREVRQHRELGDSPVRIDWHYPQNRSGAYVLYLGDDKGLEQARAAVKKLRQLIEGTAFSIAQHELGAHVWLRTSDKWPIAA